MFISRQTIPLVYKQLQTNEHEYILKTHSYAQDAGVWGTGGCQRSKAKLEMRVSMKNTQHDKLKPQTNAQ